MAFFQLNELNLNEAQTETLASIYDTFIPPITDQVTKDLIKTKHAPNDVERQEAIDKYLELPGRSALPTFLKLLSNGNMITPSDLKEIMLAIDLLSSTLGTFILTGHFQPFSTLSQEQRENVFKSFLTSYLVQKRMLANTFRALFLLLWCSDVPTPPIDMKDPFKLHGYDETRQSIIWKAIGYSGPNPAYKPDNETWLDLLKNKKIWTMPKFNFLQQYTITQDILNKTTKDSLPLRPNPMKNIGEVQYDVVIVGSGAGAGPVALQLSQSGYKVLVIEQGSYQSPHDLSGLEAESFERMYLNGACLTTTDKTMTVLSGAGFGGGTAINWSASLDTPHYVREEWSQQFGVNFCTTNGFTTCLNRIKDVMQVHPHPEDCHNGTNTILLRGSNKLGYAAKTLSQNGLGKHDCGWCSTGCKHQQKQGTNVSFLPIAINKYGLDVITDTRVEKVLFEPFNHWTKEHHEVINKANVEFKPKDVQVLAELNLSHRFEQDNSNHEPQIIPETQVPSVFLPQTPFDAQKRIATGVLVTYRNPETKELIPLKINSKIVVASAGSLQTPLLLQRSNLHNAQIGANLRLHPVIGLAGVYPDAVNCWQGTQMTSICTAYQNQKDNYGAIIETPNAHIGLMAGALPWWGGRDFKNFALNISKVCAFICLTREMTSSGTVHDREGKVQINYNFTQQDRQFLLEAIIAGMKIHAEAGAESIVTPFSGMERFIVDPILKSSDPEFHKYIKSIRAHHIVDNTVQVLSAHQMGTVRLSSNPKTGPTHPSGELHLASNLFIADASLFPTASGVNPMLTILALSQYVSLNIQQRLEKLQFIDDELKKKGLSLFDYTQKSNKND